MTDLTRRQFVVCRFKPSDQRTYTYHNDGEPVAAGDQVVAATAKGNATVDVVAVGAEEPSFPTKPIVGKAPAEQEAR